MTLTPQMFLIVCPLLFLGGLVDAIGGGGGLITLPAYMLAGVPVHQAIATNKLSSACGTTVTTAAIDNLQFQAPAYTGDMIVLRGVITSVGNLTIAKEVEHDFGVDYQIPANKQFTNLKIKL